MSEQIAKRPDAFFLDILGLKFKILSDNERFQNCLKRIFFHFVRDEVEINKGKRKRNVKYREYQKDIKVVDFKVKDLYSDLFLAYDKIMRICLEEFQSRFLLLHASSCILDGQTYVFVGKSGVGKSRAVRRLVKCGAKYVGDDPVLISKKGKLVPFPKPVLPRYTYRGRKFLKFYVPKSVGEPCPPYNFVIYEEGSGKKICVQQLGEADGAFELIKNVQNLEYQNSFDVIFRVLQKSKVFRVNRPFYIRDFPEVLRIIKKL